MSGDQLFGDALSGPDGTRDTWSADAGDALAPPSDGSGSERETWSSFELPELPAPPGGTRTDAEALVQQDQAAASVPAGTWGRLQPAPRPR